MDDRWRSEEVLPGTSKDFVDNKRTSSVDIFDAQGYPDPPATPITKRKGSVFLEAPIYQNSRFYAMNGKKRGKVLIFNQVTFDDKNYAARIGTEKDVQRLYDSLPKLGFLPEDILVHEDFSAKEIERTVRQLDTDPTLVDCDCLITVILTHGEQDDRLMARDTSYHLYQFIENFTPTALPSMAGKPKLFIVQACRGRSLDNGISLSPLRLVMDSVDTIGDMEIFTYPECADFLIVMSSHHGHFSFRNEQGSWLIQEFCNVLDNCQVEQDSIYDILTETNLAVSKRVSSAEGVMDRKKQISSFYSTLTRALYFAKR
ncbi:caspase-1-like [Uranotaenia lowii]|uniref:caspase-1-like n=1 Tax=Uranotaenia lowii TaxID=190385 RepID=UPI002479D101|nr:caspase-1-like [Uranotaenia lowii]XP_055587286.1 caspase-1-like [Uranotaenia lowii]